MKTKIFYLFIIVVIALTLSWNYSQSVKYMAYSDLVSANIEALANDESGTTTGYCYTNIDEAFSGKFQYKCNSATSSSAIYPCPTSFTEGWVENMFRDRCTK